MSVPPPPYGQPPPWQQPPPPPRRFATGAIWAGIFLALPAMLLVAAVGAGASGVLGSLADTFGGVTGFGGFRSLGAAISLQVLPLIAGVVLAVIPGTPTRRGLGLGLVIGWAVWSIIAAGACALLLVALSQAYS